MSVTGVSSTSTVSTTSSEETGFNSLSSENFLQMMIVQLQNQDPLEPTGNEELLNQISQMRSLQSSIELSESLKSATSQQQLTSAASLIGKTVTGTVSRSDGTVETVRGVVERAFVRGGDAFVGVNSSQIAIGDISDVQ